MSSNKYLEILKSIPQNIRNFNRLSMGIAAKLDDILKDRELSQKAFADLMGKKESEISKWLSGKHNFTIKSVANIEAKLNTTVLFTTYDFRNEFDEKSSLKSYLYQKEQVNSLITVLYTLTPTEHSTKSVIKKGTIEIKKSPKELTIVSISPEGQLLGI